MRETYLYNSWANDWGDKERNLKSQVENRRLKYPLYGWSE